jgi:hypothetical protein
MLQLGPPAGPDGSLASHQPCHSAIAPCSTQTRPPDFMASGIPTPGCCGSDPVLVPLRPRSST